MNEQERSQHVGKLLIDFFHINKVPKDVAATAMLGLYMAVCSEIGVPHKEMKKRFDLCLQEYRKYKT